VPNRLTEAVTDFVTVFGFRMLVARGWVSAHKLFIDAIWIVYRVAALKARRSCLSVRLTDSERKGIS